MIYDVTVKFKTKDEDCEVHVLEARVRNSLRKVYSESNGIDIDVRPSFIDSLRKGSLLRFIDASGESSYLSIVTNISAVAVDLSDGRSILKCNLLKYLDLEYSTLMLDFSLKNIMVLNRLPKDIDYVYAISNSDRLGFHIKDTEHESGKYYIMESEEINSILDSRTYARLQKCISSNAGSTDNSKSTSGKEFTLPIPRIPDEDLLNLVYKGILT